MSYTETLAQMEAWKLIRKLQEEVADLRRQLAEARKPQEDQK